MSEFGDEALQSGSVHRQAEGSTPWYMSWKPDPFAWRTDAFAVGWTDLSGYAFPLSVDQPVLGKGASLSGVFVDSDDDLSWPALGFHNCCTCLRHNHFCSRHRWGCSKAQKGEDHSLLVNQSLHLAIWKVSGVVSLVEEFWNGLPRFGWTPDGPERNPITAVAGTSGLAGVVAGRQILFTPLWNCLPFF